MSSDVGSFFVVFGAALSVSMAVTPLSIFLGQRMGLVDKPGGRRKGHQVIPRVGGIAIFTAFVIAAVLAQFTPVPRFDPKELIRFTGLMLGVGIVFAAGLLDDWFDLPPRWQFVGQFTAAGIAVAFQIFIQSVNNPVTGQQLNWSGWHGFTVVVSVLWIVLMINTVNFLDGLDGLASGVSIIACVMLFVHSAYRLQPAQTSVSLLPLALCGAALGFLLYNFYPARVFMGSSGAYVLGFSLGTLSIIGGAKMATILLVMGLPLLDVGWQVVNRLSLRRSPLKGDRGHLHFRLVDMGIPQRVIVLTYYLFCTVFGTLTLMTSSRLFKLIALLVMFGLAVAGFALLKRMEYVKTQRAARQAS